MSTRYSNNASEPRVVWYTCRAETHAHTEKKNTQYTDSNSQVHNNIRKQTHLRPPLHVHTNTLIPSILNKHRHTLTTNNDPTNTLTSPSIQANTSTLYPSPPFLPLALLPLALLPYPSPSHALDPPEAAQGKEGKGGLVSPAGVDGRDILASCSLSFPLINSLFPERVLVALFFLILLYANALLIVFLSTFVSHEKKMFTCHRKLKSSV